MLDFELAGLYGYETRYFNRQVKNNIDRFPDDFMFQLNREEWNSILKCKNFTSSWGGTRKLPFAFTEQGIYMLTSVLNGDLAIKQSISLIRLFKAMKDYIVENNHDTCRDCSMSTTKRAIMLITYYIHIINHNYQGTIEYKIYDIETSILY